MDRRSPLTVAGAAPALNAGAFAPDSRFTLLRGHQRREHRSGGCWPQQSRAGENGRPWQSGNRRAMPQGMSSRATIRPLLVCALLLWTAQVSAGPPQRIASLNKCADQLLVTLVDPSRIASVSPIATDE